VNDRLQLLLLLLCLSGTDEKAIIDVLSARSNDQRQQIKLMFKTMFGKVCFIVKLLSLNSTRHRTGSQCSWHSTGVMWSQRLAPVMRRAAASFCSDWTLLMTLSVLSTSVFVICPVKRVEAADFVPHSLLYLTLHHSQPVLK